ncbi:MAG: biliverdin-producing heme oxygenase [Chloroflexota bacterium]
MTIAARPANAVAETQPTFSARLRAGTREDHEQAEGSAFVSAYLGGRVALEGYAALQGQLWFVYEAIETSASLLRGHPVVGPFLDPRLDRLPSLDADLRALVGDDWRATVRPNEATRAHAARIREVAADWPAGFVAHHYIRYLGDLSGGRALGAKARTLYGLDDAGARFYRFDEIDSVREFKDHYRRLLDSAPWSLTEQDRIIEEARAGFRLTRAMFDRLGAALGVGEGA